MNNLEQFGPILGAVLACLTTFALILHRLIKLSESFTKPGENGGKRESRLGAIESQAELQADTLASHGKMHRKQFAAIGRLQDGQNEVLEYLTNGAGSKRPKVNYDIDAEDTGTFEAISNVGE